MNHARLATILRIASIAIGLQIAFITFEDMRYLFFAPAPVVTKGKDALYGIATGPQVTNMRFFAFHFFIIQHPVGSLIHH